MLLLQIRSPRITPAGEQGLLGFLGGFVTSQNDATVPAVETLGDPYIPSEAAVLLEETARASN